MSRDFHKPTEQLKAFVRTKYAWPGGYPLYAVMRDGETVCHECVSHNFKQIMRDTRRDPRSDWAFLTMGLNYEDELYCCNCNEPIERAYEENEDV